jgi:hypothetical protein
MDGSPATTGSTNVHFQDNNGYAEFPGLIAANLLELSEVKLSFSFMRGTTSSTIDINLLDSIADGKCMKLKLKLFSNIVQDSTYAFLRLDTREKRPTQTGSSIDNYFGSVLGTIYISNVSGKLRFTSEGELTATDATNKLCIPS